MFIQCVIVRFCRDLGDSSDRQSSGNRIDFAEIDRNMGAIYCQPVPKLAQFFCRCAFILRKGVTVPALWPMRCLRR